VIIQAPGEKGVSLVISRPETGCRPARQQRLPDRRIQLQTVTGNSIGKFKAIMPLGCGGLMLFLGLGASGTLDIRREPM
jgi:hypothetical protein